ncbi:hypothetical protein EDC04DRAFT_2600111 [Pisolithus marmoratus]|nr:hypothetical protein EDC04DRAFT_2600111 [Pisolithus marmoratus]
MSDSKPEISHAVDDRRSNSGASEVISANSADMDDGVLAEKFSVKKEHGVHTTSTTSVGITHCMLPLSKKVELKVTGNSNSKVSPVSQGLHKTKPCSKYSNSDLPVPVDSRWTNQFLDMATLWAGSQPNIWTIPEDAMASQCLTEWQSGFGSTVLVMVIDLFSKIDKQPHEEVASQLPEDYIFIHDDMDEPNHTHNICSHFILQLIANAHLSKDSDTVDIPTLCTWELLEGYWMDGVITLATAALEHAFSFVRDGIIDIKAIIKHMEANGSKLEIRLLEMLNKATRKETSGPYMFSVSNWGKVTTYLLQVERMRYS